MAHVLLIDDDTYLRDYLRAELTARGHTVEALDSAEKGIDRVSEERFDIVILDNRMPRMTGLEFLKQIRSDGVEVPVILMTASHTFTTVVEAIKLGAVKYIVKPPPTDRQKLAAVLGAEIEAILARVRESARSPNVRFATGDAVESPGKPVGKSESMLEVAGLIAVYADRSHPVLIWGETGTGKELVARAIHDESPRKGRPFIPVNCGAINMSLAESELFGHMKGAFTGADRDHAGYFEQADGGTLFLDEIGEMPLGLQVKLLRVLEGYPFKRLGGNVAIEVDVRVLAATHCDLLAMVREGTFREDLYSRLNCLDIRLPALRERLEDLPDLVHCFLVQEAEQTGRRLELAEATLERLRAYHWPRNVRQLKHVIANAVALCQGSQILPGHLKFPTDGPAKPAPSPGCDPDAAPEPATEAAALAGLRRAIIWAFDTGQSEIWPLLHDLLERELLAAALERCADQTAIASRVGMSWNTVSSRLKKYNLKD